MKHLLFLSRSFSTPVIRATSVALVLCQVVHKEKQFLDRYMENTDSASKDNKYGLQKENTDICIKIELVS